METVTYSITQVDAQVRAGSVDNDVHVYFQQSMLVSVNSEFVVTPSPDEFAYIVENEKKRECNDKNSHKAAKLCT